MEDSQLEKRVDGNTADIKQTNADLNVLVRTVDKLAVMMDNNESNRKEDAENIKNMAKGIEDLGKNMAHTLTMASDVAKSKEDIRILQHDMVTVKGAQTGMVPLLTDARTEITALKTWKDTVIGGGVALEKGGKIVWTIVGVLFTVAAFIFVHFIHIGPITVGG